MTSARTIRVSGVVQGVGFRPFVFRLARANSLVGWVLNEESGVEIHLEGSETDLKAFVQELESRPPAAARITDLLVSPATPEGFEDFTIRRSESRRSPSVRVSPDLAVCEECLRELFDAADRRYLYPYVNCTNCGPRYSIIEQLPYDRCRTTMKSWPLDAFCHGQYDDPADRRFHAQPVACSSCGPKYEPDVARVARMLNDGLIVAIKGIGGFHLACDARNAAAVRALRQRKFRKEKPFAVMVRSLEAAHEIVELSEAVAELLTSTARPIVLMPAKGELIDVAPDNSEIGVMLPYAPLHHLIFAAGAPEILVLTSANRSSEPIAYKDEDARNRLKGIADAFMIGERPIARRVDDSVVRAGAFGPMILRRSRGYAPGAVSKLPVDYPILAAGADLKNAITLVVNGQAFVSQHIGDLEHYEARLAFDETIRDLTAMYELNWDEVVVAHDKHPQYVSTLGALELASARKVAVQHHQAHIASVLAEKEAWEQRVVGVSFDGTGFGEDGKIWGGEFFVGSVMDGFERVMHLREAILPGGDAAAKLPMQCAAGFLDQLSNVPDLTVAPFHFSRRYAQSRELVAKQIRTFATTSIGRLFDAAAAVLGFTGEITFEGQAAIWLEQFARRSRYAGCYSFPVVGEELDYRPLLEALLDQRMKGVDIADIARSFQRSIAKGMCDAVRLLCDRYGTRTVVLSGGVFQNELLLEDVKDMLTNSPLLVWTNSEVPPNDGGISLGQAALCMSSPSY